MVRRLAGLVELLPLFALVDATAAPFLIERAVRPESWSDPASIAAVGKALTTLRLVFGDAAKAGDALIVSMTL